MSDANAACDLAAKSCIPCQGGVPPLTETDCAPLLEQLDDWSVVEMHHLEKEFGFSDFKSALAYVNRVGAMAEEENHHPDIFVAWGRVVVQIWTHKINGLTESDFVFAAKCDALYGA